MVLLDSNDLLNDFLLEKYTVDKPAIVIENYKLPSDNKLSKIDHLKLAYQKDIDTNFIDYSIPLKATNQLQNYQINDNFAKQRFDKAKLYKQAFQQSSTFSNPAIMFLISGNSQINQLLKLNDHKKYADAILINNPIDWSKDKSLTLLMQEANKELKESKLTRNTISKIEDYIEKYFIIPDKTKGLDDQIRVTIDLPTTNFDSLKEKIDSPKADNYIKCMKHIHNNWNNLIRKTPVHSKSSLIPLPNPYVVPGGRFREIYYWDSYFTILGLKRSGLNNFAREMAENFLYMVEEFGFVPNGNRIYYLSRSQPPFLALMIDVVKPDDLSKPENKAWLEHAYNVVAYEYENNWMDPQSHYIPEIGLNRYFDAIDDKRPECFRDDNNNVKIKKGFYQNERSECESGLDFTRRFAHRASNFIPVDLNSLLYKYEKLLEKWAKLLNKDNEAQEWANKAQKRKEKMMEYLYNNQDGLFYDYDFINKVQSKYKYISMIYPLWVEMIDKNKAKPIVNEVLKNFEVEGGILTSLKPEGHDTTIKASSEYQWDCPNGWPPIQLITIQSLDKYDYNDDAKRIAQKWLDLNTDIYNKTGKIFEKYNVIEKNIDVRTSYPQQDGFGWTNGVYLELIYSILSKANDDKSK